MKKLCRPTCLAAVVAAGLAGCSAFSDYRDLACPDVVILGDARNLVRLQSGSTGPDAGFRGRITDFNGSCSYDEKEVMVSLEIEFTLTRDSISSPGEVSFSYFVALPDHHPDPSGKRIFPVEGRFDPNQVRLVHRDELTVTIPVVKPGEAVNTLVVLGFQLTSEELDHNREQRRKRRSSPLS